MVTIVVSNYNRPQYTKRSLESLKKATDNNVIVIDDGSEPQNVEELKGIVDPTWGLHLHDNNVGIQDLVNTYPGYVDTKYIYITDNDMEYKEALDKDIREGIRIIENERNDTVVSLYNSSWHPVTGRSIYDGFVTKASIGGCSWLCKTSLMQDFLNSKDNTGHTWDWNFVRFLDGADFIVKEVSTVYHFGEKGLHSRIGNYDITDTF